jgi:hypothetical protein
MLLMRNRQTGWARRALWVFAIVANAASLAWFADLLQATDTRTKLDTVAAIAAVQSSTLYGYEDATLDIIAKRAEGIIARFADQSDYAFLSAAQVEIIPETALSRVKVRITHQLPTRYLKYFGVSTWMLQSDVTIQMKFNQQARLPMA